MSFVGAGGTTAAPTAGDYVVATTPVVVVSTAPWSLKDSAGNLIETVPATEARTVPLGYRVPFPSGTRAVFAGAAIIRRGPTTAPGRRAGPGARRSTSSPAARRRSARTAR